MEVRLTKDNAKDYIGYNIKFSTRGERIIKKILGVSETGKSIKIDHQDLNNSLEIVNRMVYVILEKS
jgi:hypothetical protein